MTKDFNVSVSMNQAAPVKTGVVLKQGDFGFDLKITVLDFTVTGTTPQIVFRKPMGSVESTDVTASGNVYTYTFKGTELDTPGKVFCDLKLKNSTTQRISTASFQFECIADTLDGLTEESSSYSDTIAQIVGGFDKAIDTQSRQIHEIVNQEYIIEVDEDDISGTWYKSLAVDMAPGTYTIEAANIISSDTDATTCLINFLYNDTQVGYVWATRGENYSENKTLSGKVNKIDFYASSNSNRSRGDTFAYSGVKIYNQSPQMANNVKFVSQSLTTSQKTVARNNIGAANSSEVSNLSSQTALQNTQIHEIINEEDFTEFAGNVSGIRYVELPVNMEPGIYHFEADNIASSDTDDTTCLVDLWDDDSQVTYILATRGDDYSNTITLNSKVTKINFFASSNYLRSANDTFTFSGVKIYSQPKSANNLKYIDQTLTDGQKETARNNIKAESIDNFVNAGFKFSSYEVTTIGSKVIANTGAVTDYSNHDNYMISNNLSVLNRKKVVVNCSANYSNAACVFYKEDGTVSEIALTVPSGGTITTFADKELDVPEDASYMILAGINNAPSAKYNAEYLYFKKYTGLKWAVVGDSLTEENIRTSIHYHDYIKNETGISVVNFGVSGSGYKRKYDTNNAFYQRVLNLPTDADVVTIFGSGNDMSFVENHLGTATDTGTDTLGGCINTTIDNIYSVIPTVQLGIIAPTPWASYNPVDNTNAMAQYTELLRQICYNRSIPFLDLYHESNLRPWDVSFRPYAYSKDDGNGTHPDETGHKLIAGRFKVFLDSLIGKY